MKSILAGALAAALLLPACGRAGAGPEPQFTNRLINEASPYLRQHAHNPVDWYPWGDEAFEKARREDKPVFLSIGYSTCHWCHVMEAESFSNQEIAAYLNEHFVAIKVDREERPDLDRLYMGYVIGVSEGGWPMSVFLTPDRQPFFGANYLPPDDRDDAAGFRTVLAQINEMWRTNRAVALRAAAEGTQAMVARTSATTGAATIDMAEVAAQTFRNLERSFDAEYGGFGGAPKFPRPVVFTFLLRYHARTGEPAALDMTLATLRAMARSGLRDQLGGGFHRYATDRAWQTPHFEKMLYDQAQLIVAYTEAYQASRDPFFADVARDTIAYVLRDMRDPGGGFYSAEDADSRTGPTEASALEEGAFYVWTASQVRHAAGSDAAQALAYYGVGNEGAHVLRVSGSLPADTAARIRQKLLAARADRPRPHRDDKVLTAWNGLMLSALSRAASAFDDRAYLDAALANAAFIERNLYDSSTGELWRRWMPGQGAARQGEAGIAGLLEDYALLIQGLLDLYEASFDPRWLAWAMRLQDTQDRLFLDAEGGGYFSTRADAADLLARAKEEYDGAEPSGNSVSAMNLLRLWRFTAAPQRRATFDATVRVLSPRLSRSGTALPQLLAALELTQSRGREIVIAGNRNAADTRTLLRLVHDRFMPNVIVLVADDDAGGDALRAMVPFINGMTRRDGRATIFVCENYACRLPTSDPAVAAELLQ